MSCPKSHSRFVLAGRTIARAPLRSGQCAAVSEGPFIVHALPWRGGGEDALERFAGVGFFPALVFKGRLCARVWMQLNDSGEYIVVDSARPWPLK